MNKRLTVNSLAGHNIKAGKKKYTLMIIGIVLAMVFSTGAVFMTSSIISGVKDLVDKNIGRENIIFCGLDDNVVTDALNAGIIADYAEGENIGYIISEGNGDGASVAKLSDKAYDMTYTTVLEGRYPERKGEIALENDFYLSLKTDAEVGDEITVKFKVQSGNEYLEKEIEKTYVLTGILHDRRKLIYENSGMANIPAAFVSSEEEVEIGGKAQKLIFAMKGSRVNSSSFYNFITPYQINSASGGEGLFLNRYMYNLPSGATIIIENGALMVVLAVVMMIASCIGIVNAFNSNLLERKKQIGLLRAIGTTKRQIFKIFGREAFIIALICTPISIFVSFFGTKLIISLIGNGLIFIPNFAVLAGGAAFSVVCVMAAALIPLKRASSISPMQAVRNVDMIRRMKKRKIKQKKEFNVSLLTAKRNMTFSKGKTAAVSIMLIITILLSSVAVAYLNHEFEENFITSSTDYYVRTYYGSFNNYMNNFYSDSKEMLSENTLRDVMRNPYVESVTFSESRRVAILPQKESKFLEIYSAADKDLLLDETDAANINKDNYKEYLEKNVINDELESYAQSKLSLPSNIVGADLLAVNDKKLKNIESRVAEGKINIDKINSGEEIIIVVPKGEAFLCALISTNPSEKNQAMLYVTKSDRISVSSDERGIVLDSAESDFHVGDEIDLSMIYYFENDGEGLLDDNIEEGSIEKYDKTVKIGAIIESDITISQYEYAYPLGFVTSISGFETFGAKHRIDNFSINLKSECTEEINESVMDTINRITAGMNNPYIHSEYETQRSDENTAKALYTALASIILLLFAICVNIVNNSLTSRIRENKREIGTLRAVGATVGELTKSYIYQLSYMLSVGVVGGLGLLGALFVGAKIYEKATGVSIIPSFRFEIPILICLTLFVICSLNLYIQIKKMTKNSIIENIREL